MIKILLTLISVIFFTGCGLAQANYHISQPISPDNEAWTCKDLQRKRGDTQFKQFCSRKKNGVIVYTWMYSQDDYDNCRRRRWCR